MIFTIPKTFQLGGSTINIEKVKQVAEQNTDCDGMAFYCKSKIELKDDPTFSNDYKEFVFWHEYFHHLFNSISREDLRKDENLINQLATIQMQAIRTME